MITVSQHARIRYCERVEPCSLDEARDRIMAHARAIEAAASIGCQVVRLGGGERLVLDGATVVTIYPKGDLPRQCRSQLDGSAVCAVMP